MPTLTTTLISVSIYLLTVILQVGQGIQDVLLLYCIYKEANRVREQKLTSAAVAVVYLILRGIAVLAALGPVFAVRGMLLWLTPWLMALNLVLFCPPRLVTLACHAIRLRSQDNRIMRSSSEQKHCHALLPSDLPMILVVIPCYRETEAVLLATLYSVARSTYPVERLHIFLSFDGTANLPLFNQLVEILGAEPGPTCISRCAEGFIDDTKISIQLFEHAGKAQCQSQTLGHVRKYHSQYAESNTDTHVLLLDSDTVLPPNALSLLSTSMCTASVERPSLVALSCVQGASDPDFSFLSAMQDGDFVQHSVLHDVTMAALGNVTCLSGNMIYARLAPLLMVFHDFVGQRCMKDKSLFAHWKHAFGDDRILTQLIAKHSGCGATDISTELVSETEAVLNIRDLVSQRRRWFLGTVATEAAALCNEDLWLNSPLQSSHRLFLEAAAVSELQVVAVLCASWAVWPAVFWRLSVILLLAFAANFGVLLAHEPGRCRRTAVLAYPLIIVLTPFFNFAVRVYSLLSLCDCGWGGTRGSSGGGTS